jgi:hypothetical protein
MGLMQSTMKKNFCNGRSLLESILEPTKKAELQLNAVNTFKVQPKQSLPTTQKLEYTTGDQFR